MDSVAIERLFDALWIIWPSIGAVIQGLVTFHTLRDYHWVQASDELNGGNERDAFAALIRQVILLGCQVVMLVAGALRLSADPNPSYYWYWIPPNKFVISGSTVIIVSTLLMIVSLLDLRLRRQQLHDQLQRMSGDLLTREGEPDAHDYSEAKR